MCNSVHSMTESANAMQDVVQDVAAAAASDLCLISDLMTSNQELKDLVLRLTTIVQTVQLNLPISTSISTSSMRPFKLPKPNGNYCWIHSFCIGKNDTSQTCKSPSIGHLRQ